MRSVQFLRDTRTSELLFVLGCWQLCAPLCTVLGVDTEVAAHLAAVKQTEAHVFATAMVLAWLRHFARHTEATWAMMAEKALCWIEAQEPSQRGSDAPGVIVYDVLRTVLLRANNSNVPG